MLRRLTCLFALIASPALSQSYELVFSGDFNANGVAEMAAITRGEEDDFGALTLFEDGEMLVHVPEIIWIGGIGQEPEMEMNEAGSLLVRQMNISIGRNRWEETITIAYRDGSYWVYGYTYGWYDTLNLADQGRCDVNLATGRGVLHVGEDAAETSFTTNMGRVRLADWTGEGVPECRQ